MLITFQYFMNAPLMPERPHQGLWNFTPVFVHETNNNALLLEHLALLKYEAKIKRSLYWEGTTYEHYVGAVAVGIEKSEISFPISTV